MTDQARGRIETPLGPVAVVVGPAGVRELRFVTEEAEVATDAGSGRAAPLLATLRRELADYFATLDRGGLMPAFTVPVAAAGTEFQRQVWAEVARVPAGETRSYGEIARQIGRPGASRAVGAANGANPVSLLIPCHRVVGADGSLTGYAYGTWRKRTLLEGEAGIRRWNLPAPVGLLKMA